MLNRTFIFLYIPFLIFVLPTKKQYDETNTHSNNIDGNDRL